MFVERQREQVLRFVVTQGGGEIKLGDKDVIVATGSTKLVFNLFDTGDVQLLTPDGVIRAKNRNRVRELRLYKNFWTKRFPGREYVNFETAVKFAQKHGVPYPDFSHRPKFPKDPPTVQDCDVIVCDEDQRIDLDLVRSPKGMNAGGQALSKEDEEFMDFYKGIVVDALPVCFVSFFVFTGDRDFESSGRVFTVCIA